MMAIKNLNVKTVAIILKKKKKYSIVALGTSVILYKIHEGAFVQKCFIILNVLLYPEWRTK